VRDGRDVALSVLKLPWGPNDVVGAADWWDEHVMVARRVGAVLGSKKYLEVHYERLVERPEEELRRCCAFIGEPYSPAMLDYAAGAASAIPAETRGLHHGVDASPYRQRVFAWKREMHPADIALFNRHAQRMLAELGYDVSTPTVGRSRLAMRYMIAAGRRFMGRAAIA
jgi:NADH:ubiquinone oxidoreductase subunit